MASSRNVAWTGSTPATSGFAPRHRRRVAGGDAGFSLIELLIVVAVIAIIAGIAIPSLTSSKKAANEAAAISYMRTWTAAQELYLTRYGHYADADDQLTAEGYIGVGNHDQLGYTFSIDSGSTETHVWWGTGDPDTPGITGDRHFYIDSTGVIRYAIGGRAGPGSTPLGATPAVP